MVKYFVRQLFLMHLMVPVLDSTLPKKEKSRYMYMYMTGIGFFIV